MKRVTACVAVVLFGAGVVLSAQTQGANPTSHVFPPGNRPLTLVPVFGTWTADYENSNQVLTIDGTAAARPPHAEAISDLWKESAPPLIKAWGAPGAFPLAIARDVPNFAGGRMQVEFKLISGATDQSAGIAFNVKPDGSYLFARYNIKDGNVAVWKFENGARTVLTHGEKHETLPLNQWHTLDVVVTATEVTATAAGRLPVSHKLAAPVSGRVGVWTKPDSVTAFRHFRGNPAGHR